jgi:hypothetical protein
MDMWIVGISDVICVSDTVHWRWEMLGFNYGVFLQLMPAEVGICNIVNVELIFCIFNVL